MEVIGIGLKVIGHALSSAVGWAGFICVAGIVATTFLVYTKTISFDDVKDFLKRDKRGRY